MSMDAIKLGPSRAIFVNITNNNIGNIKEVIHLSNYDFL